MRGWALFAAVAVLWGVVYLFLKITGDDISPSALTFVRSVLAAAILIPLAARAGTLPSLRARFVPVTVMALGYIVIPFVALAEGVADVSTALAAILGATTPLMLVAIALPFDRSERVGPVQLAGLVIGLGGVALPFAGDLQGDEEGLIGATLVLIAALGYAVGTLYYKHAFRDDDPVGAMGWIFAVSAVLLLPPAVATAPQRVPGVDVIVTIVILGVFCSALVHVLYLQLVNVAGAGRASVVLYACPLVAILLGVVFLDERLTVGIVGGLVLVMVGAHLSTRPRAVAEPAGR
jgi:drug/metabolite transporter (DMT)-like permease